MSRPRKYPQELLERGARVVLESGRPIASVARDLGVAAESLRRYVRQVEANEGLRPDLPTAAEREEIKALRKEVFELRRANEILKAASVFFATELDAERTRRPRSSTSVAVVSASSPSAGSWAGRRPRTTNERPATGASAPSRIPTGRIRVMQSCMLRCAHA